MRCLLALIGLSCAVPAFAAPVDIGGGMEQFVWQEYATGGSKLLKESGQRLFMSVEAENEVSDRWTYGFFGKIYSGTVNYDGQLMSGTPYSTDSDYNGILADIDFTGRFLASNGEYSDLGLRFGLGGDAWRRHILGTNGYTEEYVVVFGKLGLAYMPQEGWFGDVGAKYPFSVNEDVKLYDHVSLSPQGTFSLYATAGYNFNQRWSVKGYYSGYRFKASDSKPLTNGGVLVSDVYQPRSTMDLYGLTVGIYF